MSEPRRDGPDDGSGSPAPRRDGARREALERALDAIRKRCGPGSIMRLGAGGGADGAVEVISTGSLALDIALGVGGIPRGRITEVFGPEASGKTTLALHAIANAQRAGGVAVMIDAEHALDAAYARRIGVDTDELLVSQPDHGEQALEIAETLVTSGAVAIIVIDSVAALVPKAELEGEMGDSFIGLQARLMSQALRKLTGVAHRTGTALVFTNQLREKIGVQFGNPETTSGGRALKFYTTVRIDLRRLHALKDGDRAYGNRVMAKVVKNKLAPPFRSAEIDVLFDRGIAWTHDVLDIAVELGIVKRAGGGWLSFGDERLGNGRDRALAFLDDNRDIAEAIERAVMEDRKA